MIRSYYTILISNSSGMERDGQHHKGAKKRGQHSRRRGRGDQDPTSGGGAGDDGGMADMMNMMGAPKKPKCRVGAGIYDPRVSSTSRNCTEILHSKERLASVLGGVPAQEITYLPTTAKDEGDICSMKTASKKKSRILLFNVFEIKM